VEARFALPALLIPDTKCCSCPDGHTFGLHDSSTYRSHGCLRLCIMATLATCHCKGFFPPPPPMARQSLLGQGLLIVEASRSHSDTPHSVGLLWTSDQPLAENSTGQHTTLTGNRHPCPREDSNPQSQQANGRKSNFKGFDYTKISIKTSLALTRTVYYIRILI
jgi:hypothetical protein